MKVVHVSTHLTGGAGIAAYRIHKSLSTLTDSTFLTFDNSQEFGVRTLRYKKPSILRRIKRKILQRFNSKEKHYVKLQREFVEIQTKLNGSFASLPFSTWDILSHPAIQEADIIHLHWVTGILDYPSFFSNLKKPLFWTMHDMNPIRGIFHYDNDAIKNIEFAKFNENVFDLKQSLVRNVKSPMFYISPSEWLLKEVKSSPAFRQHSAVCIPNPIDPIFTLDHDIIQLQYEMQLPVNKAKLLFIAESVKDPRKGFDILTNALKEVTNEVILLVIGNSEGIVLNGVDARFLGAISEKEKIAQIYCLADALILPSREDNLPNIMVESLTSGTPVISFDVGGMASVIVDRVNGIKAASIDKTSLAEAIDEFVENRHSFNRDAIRNMARSNFCIKKIADSYYSAYNQVLSLE